MKGCPAGLGMILFSDPRVCGDGQTAEELLRVDTGAVLQNLKVQMGSGGVTGASHRADGSALGDALPLGDRDGAQVAVQR